MLPFPDHVWLAQREYERSDGIEVVEAIVTYPDVRAFYESYGYKLKGYLASDALRAADRALGVSQGLLHREARAVPQAAAEFRAYADALDPLRSGRG